MALAEKQTQDQRNEIESPEINTHTYKQIISDKGTKNVQQREESHLNTWCRKHWKATCKRFTLDYNLYPYTKIYSKWTKDLNRRPETINYTEENIGTKFMNHCRRKRFINLTSKAREVNAKINEWDYVKPKSFCTAKKTTNERNQPNGRRYSQTTALMGVTIQKELKKNNLTPNKQRI